MIKLIAFQALACGGEPIAVCTVEWPDGEVRVERRIDTADLRALSWEAHGEMIAEAKRLKLLG